MRTAILPADARPSTLFAIALRRTGRRLPTLSVSSVARLLPHPDSAETHTGQTRADTRALARPASTGATGSPDRLPSQRSLRSEDADRRLASASRRPRRRLHAVSLPVTTHMVEGAETTTPLCRCPYRANDHGSRADVLECWVLGTGYSFWKRPGQKAAPSSSDGGQSRAAVLVVSSSCNTTLSPRTTPRCDAHVDRVSLTRLRHHLRHRPIPKGRLEMIKIELRSPRVATSWKTGFAVCASNGRQPTSSMICRR